MKLENLTASELRAHFAKGRFATVLFTKADGTDRLLNGKTTVLRAINGNGTYNPASAIKVFDVNIRNEQGVRVGGYRTVTVDRVKEIRANRRVFVIDREVKVPVPFIRDIARKNDVLIVKMNKSNEYHFFGVPINKQREFAMAESKGTYFNENIKGKYTFSRIS